MTHLLLDLDGTLTDPQQGIIGCIRYALGRAGRPVPAHAELLWCIGPPLHVSFAQLAPDADEKGVWELVGFYRERFSTVGLFENAVYPEVPASLSRLATRHRLHLATSKPRVFAARILDHFGLSPHFTSVNGSELDGTRADKGDLVAHILRTQRIAAAEALMVGDRLHDVVGAKKNGVRSVGVTWGYGSREELTEAGADEIVTALGELEALCDSFARL